MGEVWKGLEMPARGALECCELSFTGDCGWSLEDQNADKNGHGKDKVSNGNKDSTARSVGYVCHPLAENSCTFCSCPETLRET